MTGLAGMSVCRNCRCRWLSAALSCLPASLVSLDFVSVGWHAHVSVLLTTPAPQSTVLVHHTQLAFCFTSTERQDVDTSQQLDCFWSEPIRRIARILHWRHRNCKGSLHFSLKIVDLFSHRPQNLSSPSSGPPMAYLSPRTFLIERAVLLYWIKQALRPNKDSFR